MLNMFTISVTSAESDSAKVLELTDPYCAAEVANQQVIIQFIEYVYLTRMSIFGSTAIRVGLYYSSNDTLYVNAGGFNVSFNCCVCLKLTMRRICLGISTAVIYSCNTNMATN